MPYSDFVTFIMKVRAFFMAEFKKYESSDFAGIDHEQAFLVDVHEFRPDTEKFAPLADLMIPTHQLADGFHGFPFAYQFKDAPHPFYQAVYKFAKNIDPDMADLMDACIIR